MNIDERAARVVEQLAAHGLSLADAVEKGTATKEQANATLISIAKRHLRAVFDETAWTMQERFNRAEWEYVVTFVVVSERKDGQFYEYVTQGFQPCLLSDGVVIMRRKVAPPSEPG